MKSRRVLEGAFMMVLSLALAGATPKQATGARARISVGEVTASVAGAAPGTAQLLRRLLTEEVSRLTPPGSAEREGYVLSASLVRLDVRRTTEGAVASSLVSATLRREGSGAILALLEGRGRVQADGDALASARESAIEAAVRGAVRRVPEAL